MTGLCPVCGEAGEKTCGACKSVSYCSSDHQRADWKTHMELCTPFLIQDSGSPSLGKQMVAARKLKAGSLVLVETPVFHAPAWTEETLEGIPNCLTCGLYMKDEEIQQRRCSSCHWPVCSESCEKDELHTENECRLFKEKSVSFPPPEESCQAKFISGIISMIRGVGLRKKEGGEYYREIMDLQQEADYRYMQRVLAEGSDMFAQELEKLVGGSQNLEDPLEDYKKVWRLCRMNEFTGPFVFDDGGQDVPAAALKTTFELRKTSRVYPKASRINHSCSPNCSWSLTSFPACEIRVRTLVDVKKGQALTFSYHNRRDAEGTWGRQREMRKACGFICVCERCLDKTECGTLLSAVTCQVCRDRAEQKQQEQGNLKRGQKLDHSEFGYFLPDDPLDVEEPDAAYTCIQCGAKARAMGIQSFVQDLQEKVQRLEAEKSEEEEPTSALDYELFLEKFEHKAVHRNHWILQQVKENLLRKYHEDVEPSELTQRCLQRCIDLRLNLLENLKVTAPGLNPKNIRTWDMLRIDLEALLEEYSREMDENERRANVKLCRRAQTIVWDYYEKVQLADLEGKGDVRGPELEEKMKIFADKYKTILES